MADHPPSDEPIPGCEYYRDFLPTKLAGALRAGSLYGAVTGRLFLPFPQVNAFDEQPDSQ